MDPVSSGNGASRIADGRAITGDWSTLGNLAEGHLVPLGYVLPQGKPARTNGSSRQPVFVYDDGHIVIEMHANQEGLRLHWRPLIS